MTSPKMGTPRRKDFILPAIILFFFLAFMARSYGQDPMPLREWFNSLKSPAGQVCCVDFDGLQLYDQEWRTSGNKYQALVKGKWIDIPADTVVEGPNRLGRAHLWLRLDGSVRCFMPGVMM